MSSNVFSYRGVQYSYNDNIYTYIYMKSETKKQSHAYMHNPSSLTICSQMWIILLGLIYDVIIKVITSICINLYFLTVL